MRLLLLLALLTFALAAGDAPTAAGLALRLSPGTAAPRAGGPLPVLLNATWDGKELRTGRPRVTLRGEGVLGHWLGPELTIAPGERSVRLWLPPWWDGTTSLDADLTWEEAGRSYALGRFELLTQPNARRVLALWSVTTVGADPAPPMEVLALERHLKQVGVPSLDTSRVHTPPFTTLVNRCAVADAPATPAQWCAADAVWLGPQAAAALDERQWAALDAWLRAGGAVWLTGTAGVPAARLAAWGVGGPGPAAATMVDQGRLVVAGVDAADGALARAFWRCPLTPDAEGLLTEPFGLGHMVHDRSPYDTDGTAALIQALMPTNVTVVPLWVLLAIYAGYLLLVGPGEWFGLGRLGLRRWTWVVFPITTALATGLTMAVAYGYLGGQDHHRRLEVIDCDAAGTALRTVRFDLHFNGGDQDLVDTAPGGLTTVVPRNQDGDRYGNGRRSADLDVSADVPTVIQGDPGEVQLRLRQWSPVLRRTTTFGGVHAPAHPAWSATRNRDSADFQATGRPPISETLVRQLCLGHPWWNQLITAQSTRPGTAWDDLGLDQDVRLAMDETDGVLRLWRTTVAASRGRGVAESTP